MKVDVEFYGIAVYECWEEDRYYDAKISSVKTEECTLQKFYCYFVLDFGKKTKAPQLYWSMYYSTKDTVRKLKEICVNPGLAIMHHDKVRLTNQRITNAEKMVVELKMKLFGSTDIPFKNLTSDEWENRYKQLSSNRNWIPDL